MKAVSRRGAETQRDWSAGFKNSVDEEPVPLATRRPQDGWSESGRGLVVVPDPVSTAIAGLHRDTHHITAPAGAYKSEYDNFTLMIPGPRSRTRSQIWPPPSRLVIQMAIDLIQIVIPRNRSIHFPFPPRLRASAGDHFPFTSCVSHVLPSPLSPVPSPPTPLHVPLHFSGTSLHFGRSSTPHP